MEETGYRSTEHHDRLGALCKLGLTRELDAVLLVRTDCIVSNINLSRNAIAVYYRSCPESQDLKFFAR